MAGDWRASPDGDSMIAHMARTHVALTPTLTAYLGSIAMGTTSAQRESRQRVYDFTLELIRRFHRAGVTILAGSDFAYRDYDQRPGQSIPREIDALISAGLSPQQARRAAGANIIEWLTTRP
jgi:hypothetical protein